MLNRIVLALCMIAAGIGVLADGPKEETGRPAAIEKELEVFCGTWEIDAVKPEGATKEARRLVFMKDGTYAALDKEGKELWAGTFEIDPTSEPKRWDHRSHEGKKNGADVLGVYELKGDTLTVACIVGQWKDGKWMGKERLKSIDAAEADVVIEMRRVKGGR